MKFRHSIITRFAFFFTGLIIFSILLSGYLVFNKASGVIVDYSKNEIKHASELAEQSFYSLLGEVSSDIAVIANSPSLKSFVQDPNPDSRAAVNQLFFNTLKNKPSYFQIRWIGVEENGREIIRFNREKEDIFESDSLQKKGDREYFRKTLELGPDEYYFSRIDLNQEYGIISRPYTPTLRAASPIFEDNTVVGILVINVDMSKLYSTFDQIARNNLQFYLVDDNGQYLYSPDKSEQFGFQKGNSSNFFSDFDIDNANLSSWEKDFQSITRDQNAFLSYTKELEYFNGRRKIHLIAMIEEDALMESAVMVRSYSLRNLIIVCLFSLITSLIFTSFFSKKIRQVTLAISNYDKEGKDYKINLPRNRKDEIGILATAFYKMKLRIDNYVQELNKALKKEKKAKKQRDEFLQNMSHEMRTPLNTILGLTQILKKESSTTSQLPIIESLEKSANNLAGLMYDVLDHQKLVEGKLQISYQVVDISKLLQDIYSNYQFEAAKTGLKFKLIIDENIKNIKYNTDPLRLSQIVTNLVVNAIKYTKEGYIELHAKQLIKGKRSYLQICVQDTGIGIDDENIQRINDRFFRENEDTSFSNRGYGLGLSIVKQLSDLFNGELRAESKKGIGSKFEVRIPAEPSEGNLSAVATEKVKSIYPELNNKYQILLIEDDISTAELVQYLLNNKNITINRAINKKSALEYLEHSSPDIVISDLMLENQNLKQEISTWISSRRIECPVIIASALEPENRESSGFVYFHKPYNVDVFKDYVYQILAEKEFLKPDFKNIYADYDNDREKIKKVLQLLQEEFKMYLDRIFKAYEGKNQKEWKAINHKLITHIHNLKLTELKENLPDQVTDITSEGLIKIRSLFAFYLCCFRNERNINLGDRYS
ncbi:ATP-binding protein [Gramella sp. KN1008]|uniref:ATP-binding protein n=1 Tax=Gramella sp. KN1008 TaxID=2529298 RepID=UPI00103E481E|nr:ATP-binding protein [Gramella sp. KN1008]TBW29122.1 response regulator [Gramella sp. KN1008]